MSNELPQLNSFGIAGYECTYALGVYKTRMDLLASTKHDIYCEQDYALIKALGITTVREGLAWNQIEQGDRKYNFSRFERMMELGKNMGIQQIWDLNHFDYPEYLDPFSPQFVTAFTEYAKRAVHCLRSYITGTLYIVPINEISYFSWIGGDMALWAPYQTGKGFELKKQLVRASIAAQDAMWKEDPDIRFIQVDPVFYRRAKNPKDKDTLGIERAFQEIKFQTWDMLSGRLEPELGGEPKYLDIIGANYYYANQEWIIKDGTGTIYNWGMSWNSKFRISFAEILQETYNRYHRPIVITETGSHGSLRRKWWLRVGEEITDAIKNNIPITGVCTYPTVDTFDWTYGHPTNSGLWDFEAHDPLLTRTPHHPSLQVVKQYLATWKSY